jgi:hypothetical protein
MPDLRGGYSKIPGLFDMRLVYDYTSLIRARGKGTSVVPPAQSGRLARNGSAVPRASAGTSAWAREGGGVDCELLHTPWKNIELDYVPRGR